jgi:nucleoside-diphosphate-sugar epimerase
MNPIMSNSESESPTVAVTGAAGYIGSRVVWQLQRDHPDWNIVALDNFYLGDVRENGDVSVEHVDIRNRSELESALEGSDVVLHLAAISGVDDCDTKPDLAYDVNVVGTANVAWFCEKTGTPLAFPFSMAVIGDPDSFPITVEMERDPLNWYGETKVLGERVIETMAEGSFPAHLFMISNLYGAHEVGRREVSKNTVINFFVNRALDGATLTVYEPGSQSRNFVHVKDVANAFCLSVEALVDEEETGVEEFEIASEEDPSVMAVAELVQSAAREERGLDVDVVLVENPRSAETMVESFGVSTERIADVLGWEPAETVEASIHELLTAE